MKITFGNDPTVKYVELVKSGDKAAALAALAAFPHLSNLNEAAILKIYNKDAAYFSKSKTTKKQEVR